MVAADCSSMLLLPILILLVVPMTMVATMMITTTIKPGCKEECGGISIPYPFGIGEGCYHYEPQYQDGEGYQPFLLNCSYSLNRPILLYRNIDVLNVSILDGELRVKLLAAPYCNDNVGETWVSTMANLGKFTFSDTKNKFFGIGCNADNSVALDGILGGTFTTKCQSTCTSINDLENGTCFGKGCCNTPIPKGIYRYEVTIHKPESNDTNLGMCNTAFVAEQDWFKFKTSYVKGFDKEAYQYAPAIMDWTIGEKTCHEAAENLTSYACGPNTYCYEPGGANGYRCKCSSGYEGNPYLTSTPGSCQDINECDDSCKGESNKCTNTEGSYTCFCPDGYRRENMSNSVTFNCYARGPPPIPPSRQRRSVPIQIIIGSCVGLIVLLVSSIWSYLWYMKMKFLKIREKFFMQNGGLMLQQLLHEREEEFQDNRSGANGRSSKSIAKIFTAEELNKATNNYDETQILGQGGYGTVYKGVLSNREVVAIKKSKVIDRTQINQFINEVVVLSQINHRNVVRLLGCCLESEVPLLVYEFITNGTLFEHLHNNNERKVPNLLWNDRLRIAAEVAGSLAYLHSDASIPIIHRDIKSSNILLDDDYKTKVSDFGASRLVPFDQTLLNTAVQGTFGYMDPEYFLTGRLTEKSDVYSFGVLLAELLTGEMAVSLARHQDHRNLANYFLSSMRESQLFHIVDHMFASSENDEQRYQVEQVAELAKRCLRIKGESRPKMKEAFIVLDGLMKKSSNDNWGFDQLIGNDDEEKKIYLLEEGRSQLSYGGSTSNTIGDPEAMVSLELGGR